MKAFILLRLSLWAITIAPGALSAEQVALQLGIVHSVSDTLRTRYLQGDEALTYLLEHRKCPGCNFAGMDLQEADFSQTDLRRADLTGANLNRANLQGADLSSAHLTATSLREARLDEARLSGAQLGGANLSGAVLHRANLSGANLSWTELTTASFSGAILTEASLRGAYNVRAAHFDQADLSKAIWVNGRGCGEGSFNDCWAAGRR